MLWALAVGCFIARAVEFALGQLEPEEWNGLVPFGAVTVAERAYHSKGATGWPCEEGLV